MKDIFKNILVFFLKCYLTIFAFGVVIVIIVILVFCTGDCSNRNKESKREVRQVTYSSISESDVMEDFKKASSSEKKMACLLIAAHKGSSEAMYLLGDNYYKGSVVGKSYKHAAKWYKQAADKGYEKAIMMLAKCYYLGHGVEQSIEEGNRMVVPLYKKYSQGIITPKEAEGGYDDFQEGLSLYNKGLYEAALVYYHVAALNGSHSAKFCIGEYYEKGVVVAKSEEIARKWYEIAAGDGNPDAKRKLNGEEDLNEGIKIVVDVDEIVEDVKTEVSNVVENLDLNAVSNILCK